MSSKEEVDQWKELFLRFMKQEEHLGHDETTVCKEFLQFMPTCPLTEDELFDMMFQELS